MKTIGIIGGFGPEATAEFYLRLVAKHREANHGVQPKIIIQNVAVPRRLEQDLLIRGKSVDKFASLLISAATSLEQNGAEIIVLPCNTLHVHEEAIRKSINVPFVSIIDATVRFLNHQKISRVGFLGSQVTVRKNLFQKKVKSVSFVSVDRKLQKEIDKGLDLFVGNQDGSILSAALRKAFTFLQKNRIKNVLLACTDFHDLCRIPPNMHTQDTLDLLVQATLNVL